jgi:nuclear GTP-binding protein
MEGLLQLLKNYARNGRDGKTCVSVGIVGYPNVGKSSIINSLKRCRAVGVSSRPGFTTAVQEVVLDKTVRLLDSPGVVFEDDADVLLKNCINVDSVTDPQAAVESLIRRCSVDTVMMTYALPRFTSADMFLAMIAKKFGKVKKGGIPDKLAAGKLVLRDWNSGKIPYFTPPPSQSEQMASVHKGQAQIVANFGKTFELCDDFIHTLEEKDELDFVQLENAQRSSKNVLDEDEQMDTDENDADNHHMDSEKVQGVPVVTNDKIKDAEDFDFAML